MLVFDDHLLYSRIVTPSGRLFLGKDGFMKYLSGLLTLLFVLIAATAAFGQGKGVDSQNQRITDNSSTRAPANNGTKQDTGTTGSGINFGREKAAAKTTLPNPYRLTARRDVLIKAVADVMGERK